MFFRLVTTFGLILSFGLTTICVAQGTPSSGSGIVDNYAEGVSALPDLPGINQGIKRYYRLTDVSMASSGSVVNSKEVACYLLDQEVLLPGELRSRGRIFRPYLPKTERSLKRCLASESRMLQTIERISSRARPYRTDRYKTRLEKIRAKFQGLVDSYRELLNACGQGSDTDPQTSTDTDPGTKPIEPSGTDPAPTPTVAIPPSNVDETIPRIQIPSQVIASGEVATLDISVGSQNQLGQLVLSASFDLSYDSNAFSVEAVEAIGVAQGWTVVSNNEKRGNLRVALYGTKPLAASGMLLRVKLRHLLTYVQSGTQYTVSPLNAMLNETSVTGYTGTVVISGAS